MTNLTPRRSLELLSPRIASLNQDICALTDQQWAAPSSCAGWQIADLVAHVVRNGWSFVTFTRRALAGDPTPAFGPAVAHIQEEIKASGAAAAADRQRRENDEFVALAGGLLEADFARTAMHPSGPRTIAWGCTQRLVEAAFHHWDLSHSLGAGGPLEPAVAGYVLPFMLDPAESPVLRTPAADAAPRSIRLTSTDDGSSWRVSVGPGGRQVEVGGAGPVEAEVSAAAGWLALALYGRTELTGEQFRCSGPAAAAFAACCRA